MLTRVFFVFYETYADWGGVRVCVCARQRRGLASRGRAGGSHLRRGRRALRRAAAGPGAARGWLSAKSPPGTGGLLALPAGRGFGVRSASGALQAAGRKGPGCWVRAACGPRVLCLGVLPDSP